MVFGCVFLFACGSEPVKPAVAAQKQNTVFATATTTPVDSALGFAKDTAREEPPPVVPVTKKPSGIYQFSLSSGDGKNILHTVAFYPTTYRLQEDYNGGDSTVVTEGTWAPSEGTIWLYRDQVLRGRYNWEKDTLQYYSPGLKKGFPMEKLLLASATPTWQTARKEGARFYGVGTEPFWSVEVTKEDSIVLNMPDWTEPLRTKLTSFNIAKDSSVYTGSDSLHITLYPRFCNDGMSDFVYTQKLKLQYKNKTYNGCGELLRRNR